MFRLSAVAGLLVAGVAIATAGQIQIGGSSGLTSTYIASGCSNNDLSGSSCYAPGTSGTVTEKNFDSRLFSAATQSSVLVSPYTTSTITGPSSAMNDSNYKEYGSNSSGQVLYDSPNGETFSMLSDGCNGTVKTCPGGTGTNNLSNDFWDVQTANAYITIPVGVLDVTDAYLLLSNFAGLAGASDTKVEFDFGSTYNQSSGFTSVIYTLTNSPGGSGGGQIQSALSCTTTPCKTTYASGTPASSTTSSLPTYLSSVTTTNVYSQLYNAATGSFASTSGNAVLNDDGFNFSGTVLGMYLVDIKITELVGGSASNTAVIAATVDSTLPEPSTVWLLVVGGAGMVAYTRRRRRTA